MNDYLAKSNPKETIQEHTDKLLENFKIIYDLHPDLEINWDILYMACLYHDLGKMNLKFQGKLKGRRSEGEIPHGILSLAFLDTKELKKKYSYDEIKILFHSIAYHHDRKLNYEDNELENEIRELEEEFKGFVYGEIGDIKQLKYPSKRYFAKNDRIYKENGFELFKKYVITKGLLNRIDYAASSNIEVERKSDFLNHQMDLLLEKWKETNSKAEWNELQKFMIENSEENVVVVAQTGMGKTEGGLLWIGDNKGFFTLPLKTAINSIYKRISGDIVDESIDSRVGLLHSDTYEQYLHNEDLEFKIEEYYTKTRQLALPLTICTLDQIFDFVFRYRGFEPKLATLSYSKIVIDEIQMYSPDLLAYLIRGLKYISEFGGRFAILTATLPGAIVDLLKKNDIEFKMPEKPFINDKIRHSIKSFQSRIDTDLIKESYCRNKILVICNTVKEAQRVYDELKAAGTENLNMFHSKYTKQDRKKKEEEIIYLGDKKIRGFGIWISTQVVEASLDIDFDLLFTELSDINGLFQRFGRCYRSRDLDKEYNCFVFLGNEKEKCTGVGGFIDKDIHNLSRERLLNLQGTLSEVQKLQLIDEVYSTENLKETKYYKDILTNIEYLGFTEDFENSKKEVQEKFRDINSYQIIPRSIYNSNIVLIREKQETIDCGYDKQMGDEERKKLKLEKIKAKNSLRNLTLSIQGFEMKKSSTGLDKLDAMEIGKSEKAYILDCDYSYELGFKIPRKSEKLAIDIEDNNMF